ncbi:hypothetical protein ZHS_87 [Edwardsiella phage vB_EpM_ZHS]|nr:hypothetical protein ZHS_87 [Edwardsiella phage vB_EpM_ZHS]
MKQVTFSRARKTPGLAGPGETPSKGGIISPGPHSVSGPPVKKEKETKVDEILALVSALSPAERKQLLAQVALLAQQDSTSKADRDLELWSTSVYEAYTQAFGRSGEAGQGPLVFRRVLAPANTWGPVADFMSASGLAAMSVVKRQAVYRMLGQLIVRRAKNVAAHNRAPVSPKFVANVAHDVRSIFEAEFPGYLAAGLAHLVAAQLGKPSPNGTLL